jgi:hypothetical protein
MGDGAVAFEPASAMLHLLNPSAALVLAGCNHGWDADGLAADVAARSGVAVEVVAADVAEAVTAFRTQGLVGDGGAAVEGPSHDPTGPGTVAAGAPPAPVAGIEPLDLGAGAPPGAPPGRRSRSLAVLDEVVCFRSADARALARVDELFADLAVDAEPSRAWELSVGGHGRAGLAGAAGSSTSFADLDGLLRTLPSLLNGRAAASVTCLALHASAVRSPRGEVVAFPAVSGSGKSTLAAHLVQRGWDYLTDEAVAIAPGSLAVLPYPKPLALDRRSRTVLGLDPDGPDSIPSDLLRRGAALAPTARPLVDRIVLVRYEPEAPTRVERLGPADAVLAVAEHALNLRRAGAPSLEALVRLASGVPCHRLVHGGLEAADAALADLVDG